ncbi:MAG: YbjQ family protein, partial [Blautia sp.]|nr:YbjQ family protein [Lachnoclostridium sp.]MCM1212156.1 YbjQ family protein [Blautia sp.]
GIGVFEFGDIGQSVLHGIESDTFSDKLEQAKNTSVNKMIDEAIKRGGNAIIGVTFDYFNFGSDMIGVVANGTVVEIVK